MKPFDKDYWPALQPISLLQNAPELFCNLLKVVRLIQYYLVFWHKKLFCLLSSLGEASYCNKL